MRQDTGWPETPSTKPTVTGAGPIDLRLRVPSWATGARLRLNGTPVAATPGGYARLDRTWASGDVVELSLPMALTRESAPDDPAVQAVKHGPIVLAGWYGTTDPGTLPTLRPDTIRATTTPMRYTATASTGQVTLARSTRRTVSGTPCTGTSPARPRPRSSRTTRSTRAAARRPPTPPGEGAPPRSWARPGPPAAPARRSS
ncbi:beta-L-arabinofuranosidase domain-containing protein [Saccharothrix yanglingensis]|uniref:beta-L-arabinofuranosidase domain-containing protein n=1 Tax=Saccharothrix yanglingensis TaxID=659496 RepID=UPI0027D310E7|nr:beta-L-arabinofuranosidase domain-containing protein [Saccharothrix yanglingensis]